MELRHSPFAVFFAFLGLISWSAPAQEWPVHGGTEKGQYFSLLDQINQQTVSRLGLVWSQELGTTRGLEATPIVQDGVIYASGAWSVVFAFEAKTGHLKWSFDPKVKRERALFVCCDVVNRGVAVHNGKVYVGTIDGRLIALDQQRGIPVWSVQTTDPEKAYSVTDAPTVAKDKIVIGNAGSEYGVRGYVTAYDSETGKQLWRFYTVPGDPQKGFESKALEAAAKTWNGDGWWKTGGGGSVWGGAAYDPSLDLLFFGTGNPTAWFRALRGGGDNLYTASIVAVKASTGELAWYYQTTPGDNFDYDATQPVVQADLTVNGHPRKVLLQANKNGFFYVLDRRTGELISAAPFADGVDWASAIDPSTGRPIERPGVAGMDAAIVSPSHQGAHNWNPMAFHPGTGLVYIPVRENTRSLSGPNKDWKYNPNTPNLGADRRYQGPLLAQMRTMPAPGGELVAWDPIAQKPAWRAKYAVVEGGGALATGGNLVFEGRADGVLAAYRATDGEQLWQADVGTGVMASPVTYTVNGTQYLTLVAGWGGSLGLMNTVANAKPGYGRILTFALDGKKALDVPPFGHKDPPVPAITEKQDPQMVAKGGSLYGGCSICHGVNVVSGPLPDLRYSSKQVLDSLQSIVLEGALAANGMPSFKGLFTSDDVNAIRAYIIFRSQESATPSKDLSGAAAR